eukprot:scaffold3017_cov270-Alexandrium_tamarense.AAC.1
MMLESATLTGPELLHSLVGRCSSEIGHGAESVSLLRRLLVARGQDALLLRDSAERTPARYTKRYIGNAVLYIRLPQTYNISQSIIILIQITSELIDFVTGICVKSIPS